VRNKGLFFWTFACGRKAPARPTRPGLCVMWNPLPLLTHRAVGSSEWALRVVHGRHWAVAAGGLLLG
jgi:hypothetical protein